MSTTSQQAWLFPRPAPGIRGAHCLTPGRHVVGRGLHCDFRLEHPSVSREHARIGVDAERLTLEDMGSHNGCYVDGHRVRLATVRVGALIRLGVVLLEIVDGDDPRLPKAVGADLTTLDASACDMRSVHESLTAAQGRVFELLLRGMSEKEVAMQLNLKPNTVHVHVVDIYRTLGVHTRAELLSRYCPQQTERSPVVFLRRGEYGIEAVGMLVGLAPKEPADERPRLASLALDEIPRSCGLQTSLTFVATSVTTCNCPG